MDCWRKNSHGINKYCGEWHKFPRSSLWANGARTTTIVDGSGCNNLHQKYKVSGIHPAQVHATLVGGELGYGTF